MKLSKSVLTKHSILFVFMLISSVNQATAGQLFGKATEEEVAKSLQEVTRTVNKTLPKMIDSSTRLDQVTGENNAFNYKYTMVKHSLSEINIETFTTSMRPKLLKNLCTNSTTEFARRYNIPMVYTYFGKSGEKVTTIKVTPSECKTTTNDTTGIFKGLLAAGMGGLGSAFLIFIGIGIIFGMKKLYFRSFRKFDEIIREGKIAFSNDLVPDDNPYSDEKERRDAWLKGWERGEKSRQKWENNR